MLEKGKILVKSGFRAKDALHLACAIEAECEYFLTTDDKILNKSSSVKEIKITDPIGFIREVFP